MFLHVQNVVDIDTVHQDKDEGSHPQGKQGSTENVELEVVEDIVVVIHQLCPVDCIAGDANTCEEDEG